jgi:hypothetical protein
MQAELSGKFRQEEFEGASGHATVFLPREPAWNNLISVVVDVGEHVHSQ